MKRWLYPASQCNEALGAASLVYHSARALTALGLHAGDQHIELQMWVSESTFRHSDACHELSVPDDISELSTAVKKLLRTLVGRLPPKHVGTTLSDAHLFGALGRVCGDFPDHHAGCDLTISFGLDDDGTPLRLRQRTSHCNRCLRRVGLCERFLASRDSDGGAGACPVVVMQR